MRSPIPVLLVLAIVLNGQSVQAADTSPETVRARLGGSMISLDKVPSFHCHDGRHPVIDCFASEGERDDDARTVAHDGRRADAAPEADIESTQLPYYVTFYEHASYGGASYTTWQWLPNLTAIYWNDIVTSFKSLNGQRPKWFVDADYGPPSHQWAAGAWVANVGDSANDRFSSVKNVP